MNTTCIVWTRADGGVTVFIPTVEMLAASTVGKIRASVVPADATNVCVCDVADLPASRRLRNQWVQHGATPPVEPT